MAELDDSSRDAIQTGYNECIYSKTPSSNLAHAGIMREARILIEHLDTHYRGDKRDRGVTYPKYADVDDESDNRVHPLIETLEAERKKLEALAKSIIGIETPQAGVESKRDLPSLEASELAIIDDELNPFRKAWTSDLYGWGKMENDADA